jgi:DNA polymerase sigma
LKESDLDLVLIIENEKTCTLNDLYLLFKAKEWLIDCNEIPAAKVPIV